MTLLTALFEIVPLCDETGKLVARGYRRWTASGLTVVAEFDTDADDSNGAIRELIRAEDMYRYD